MDKKYLETIEKFRFKDFIETQKHCLKIDKLIKINRLKTKIIKRSSKRKIENTNVKINIPKIIKEETFTKETIIVESNFYDVPEDYEHYENHLSNELGYEFIKLVNDNIKFEKEKSIEPGKIKFKAKLEVCLKK